MKAVVFDGPFTVSVQDRPVPKIQHQNDIIVKVQTTALCGSELHVYRGHQPSATGFIMGHEFTGVVVETGTGVSSVKVGDRIVSPFTVSCGNCFYCRNHATSRCVECRLFGTAQLDGAQAEFVRVPFADGTVVKATDKISDNALLLMADVFPTGYFGVKSAINMSPTLTIRTSTVVIIGCGPVGLCSVVAAAHYQPLHLFAIDSVESRLERARELGAEPLNFSTDQTAIISRIKAVTEGRGADIVIEAVGLSPALRTAFDIVRPFGTISSIGVHNDKIPWSGNEAYGKNIRLQMGRSPVRSLFPEALALLVEKQHLFDFMFETTIPLVEAPKGYELFDQMKSQKVVFKP